jgi:UDP-N-acetylglucosamine--N-acetylmuramyl-(pentapeptide) pyrophosphoryl-undecaprenol N-acetylglucosamine transferase
MEKEKQNKKIAIVGGHLTPALAVLKELKDQGYGDIIWIGTKYSQTRNTNVSLEYQVVQKTNTPFITLKAGKLWRKYTLKTLLPALQNFILIPYGFIKSFQILIKHKPAVVVSFGGHLALPMVFVAKIIGIKSITHEQTVVLGLTNKIISKYADTICVSWENSLKFFPKEKTVFTGLPIREELLPKAHEINYFNNDLPILLVMGGNQGSNTINWRLSKILPDLLKTINVIHLTGNSTLTHDYRRAIETKSDLEPTIANRYIVKENAYFEEYANYLNTSDIVLSRAGANAISEFLLHGKLTVLIPIPWASNNEQLKNAKMLEETGLGLVIEQYDEMPPVEIYNGIKKVLEAYTKNEDLFGNKLSVAKDKAKSYIKLDATKNIVEEIKKLL